MSERLQMDTKLDAATVCRAKIVRADGNVEDLGVVSASINPRSPRQWWRLAQNVWRFGWHNSR